MSLAGKARKFEELQAMSLWVDKYRPNSLSKLDYHKEQAKWLTRLVSELLFSQVCISYLTALLNFARCKVESCHTCWCMGHQEQARRPGSCAY